MSEGFEENAEFFELTYQDPALVSLGRKFTAVAPLLSMKAGAQGPRIDSIPDKGVGGAGGRHVRNPAQHGGMVRTS